MYIPSITTYIQWSVGNPDPVNPDARAVLLPYLVLCFSLTLLQYFIIIIIITLLSLYVGKIIDFNNFLTVIIGFPS